MPDSLARADKLTSPGWHFASTVDGDRYAVITDLDHTYDGWSVEVSHDGDTHLGQVTSKTLWRSDDGDFNLLGLGDSASGFAAPVEPGAIVDAFITPEGARFEIDPWAYTVEWLVESLADQPVALIIDLGPNDYVQSEDDADDVPCASTSSHGRGRLHGPALAHRARAPNAR